MKYTKYLLLLLLAASCASQRSVRHHSYQADRQPVQPAVVQQPVAVQEEEAVLEPEVVASARPLVSQVYPFPEGTWQYYKQRALDSLCQSPIFETTQLGLYVYDLTDGLPLYAINAAHRMRPASCQKVVTAVTALNCLKKDFQLRTEFRISGKVTGGVLQGNLIVVGGMDPLVIYDELLEAALTIKQKQGIDRIAGNLVFDLSMREDKELGLVLGRRLWPTLRPTCKRERRLRGKVDSSTHPGWHQLEHKHPKPERSGRQTVENSLFDSPRPR